LIVLLFLASCQKNYDASDQSTALSPQIGTVPLDVATNIATNFFKMYYENVDNKLIDNQETVDENGVPYFYLFYYKNGGFLIVSAEYGDMPILANDVSSIFPAKGEKINAGLGMWLIDTRERIKAIREGKIQPLEASTAMWSDFKNNTFKATFKHITLDDIRRDKGKVELRDTRELPNGNGCSSLTWTNTQVGPFMTTKWGQGCGYNSLVPSDHLATSTCSYCPTGCVATAMAQVVRFHNFPLGYNYAAMTNSVAAFDFSNREVAQLMADCGTWVGMDYGTYASGANTARVEGALQDWGYSTDANYGAYNTNYQRHAQSLDDGNPVILDGCTDYSCFWAWCWGTGNCHAWVSDGYQRSSHPCYGTQYGWRMNWGWDGRADGVFYNPIVELPGFYRNYQYDRDILYNIHP
jgi:Peptidase C10 family/Spi protease inhibitor